MVRAVFQVLMLGLAPLAAAAEPLTGAGAAPLLFPPAAAEVELLPAPFLPKDQAELLKTVGSSQPYYGAIAVSPDEGIMVEATVAAANHHSTDAASAAALAACDARRQGKTPCAVVALIRPAGWKAQPFQLSSSATAAFPEYVRITRDKAFAISPATGAFGQAKGRDAAGKAVRACAEKDAGATDCAVAVLN